MTLKGNYELNEPREGKTNSSNFKRVIMMNVTIKRNIRKLQEEI